ncbi:MAG: hypothetical protein QOF62_411 [Pyrinomonadaceae bacterium]|jgi:hypothetical protein|nr:hypothetical protein [Pyrinomonadaceae bacterium]
MSNSDPSKGKPTANLMADYLPPVLVADGEMMRKVDHSTVLLGSLLKGEVRPDQIERALSFEGCGAVLIKLNQYYSSIYEQFYRLQWQLGHRVFDNDTDNKTAAADFSALDTPVRELLCRCGVAVARTRKGLTSPTIAPSVDFKRFLGTNGTTLSVAIGRPLAANRKEFHPSVDWLLKQEEKGCLQKDENPSYAVLAQSGDGAGRRISGRSEADETRLLALYREWKLASPMEQKGHGNKLNGDVYYGAFRGCTHVDCGSTMSVLFGAGDLRDRDGFPVDGTTKSQGLGGTLMVASPEEKNFTALPYRLPCGSTYVVVFFEEFDQRARPAPPALIGREAANSGSQEANAAGRHRKPVAINTCALGWAATVHGVRRIEDTGFSRGQTIVHVRMTEEDVI